MNRVPHLLLILLVSVVVALAAGSVFSGVGSSAPADSPDGARPRFTPRPRPTGTITPRARPTWASTPRPRPTWAPTPRPTETPDRPRPRPQSISASVGSYSCTGGDWTFKIDGLGRDHRAPDHITVEWENGARQDVGRSSGWGTAAYTTGSNRDSKVRSASATIDSHWSGSFWLESGPCPSSGGGGCSTRTITVQTNAGDVYFETGSVRQDQWPVDSWFLSSCNGGGGYSVMLRGYNGGVNPYHVQCEAELRPNACSSGTGDCVRFERWPGQEVSQWFPNYGGDAARFNCTVVGAGGYPYAQLPYPYAYGGQCVSAAGGYGGQTFPQTGFSVRDNVNGTNFWSWYDRLGGVNRLGYPISRVFWQDGYYYQAFQKAVLQWRPEGQAAIVNIMDWLYQAGKDEYLATLGIPRNFAVADGCADYTCSKAVRSGWLTMPAIRDKVLSDIYWQDVTGLATSLPERWGPFVAQRFQRQVWQFWVDFVPGMPAPGSVVPVLVGDVAKNAGLFPPCATVPE